jgi:capsular polysaccharide biosynthesis protein
MRALAGQALTRTAVSLVAEGRRIRQALAGRLFWSLDALASRDPRPPLVGVGLRVANALSMSTTFMPIVWLDTCSSASQLAPARAGIAVGPHIDGQWVTESVVLPPVHLYSLRNVTIETSAAAFGSHDGLIVERIAGFDEARCAFQAGHLIDHGDNLAAVAQAPVTPLDHGFFLSGFGYWNYFHWMLELLPKLQYWQKLAPEVRAYPLLVGEQVFHHPSMLEALALFCDDPEIRRINDDEMYAVGHLLHINAPNVVVFNLRGEEPERVTDTFLRPEIIHDWRERVGLAQGRSAAPGRRIFLARGAERRLYNQAEVLELFLAEGFEAVKLEQMSLQDQIHTMNSAELIAGPDGAAWTNLLFCTPGAKALSWTADECVSSSLYSTLAEIVGVDLRYLTYPTDARSSAELYTANYHLDLAEVRQALGTLLRDT